MKSIRTQPQPEIRHGVADFAERDEADFGAAVDAADRPQTHPAITPAAGLGCAGHHLVVSFAYQWNSR